MKSLMRRLRSPRARRTDPQTSQDAAASISPTAVSKGQLAVLEALSRLGGTSSDHSLVRFYHAQEDLPVQSASGIRTRRKELVELKVVRDTGVRVLTESGREAILWGVEFPASVTLREGRKAKVAA